MNCAEVAAMLQQTLLQERDPERVREAIGHAKDCPRCAPLVKLHRLEVLLAELPAVSPSSGFAAGVMARIAQAEIQEPKLGQESALAMLGYALATLGALMLAVAYLVPAGGSSFLNNLMPQMGLVRSMGMMAYLAGRSPGAVALSVLATLSILLGLALAECPGRSLPLARNVRTRIAS